MQNFDVSIPMLSFADLGPELPENEIRTRMNYLAADCIRALDVALQDPSATSMGKALHFTADVVCSGGYYLWKKFCYDYAIDHIGLASIRIFLYLNARFKELDPEYERLPSDMFYANELIQKKIGEVVLVLQNSPRRGKVKWPTVGPETHRNATWLAGVRRAPDSSAVTKHWIRSADMMELFIAANEMLYACKEGTLERALFWLKWAHDEDSMLKKENSGGGLTTSDHGIALSKSAKGRASPIHFLFICAVETYKEMAATGIIKMNDEIRAISWLYTSAPTTVLTGRKRMELLVILLQVLCEVPKWKTPAATPLVKDPVLLSRAAGQAPTFFKEILARPAPKKTIKKVGKPKVKRKGEEGKMTTEQKLAAFDAAVNQFYGADITGLGGGAGR